MTDALYLQDAYRQSAPALVAAHTPEGGIVLDATLFYPTSGGQPGDSGQISWPGGTLEIATTVKTADGHAVLVPATAGQMPPPGTEITQTIDWDRRFAHMRVHTALHLLSVAVPLPVTGGSISAGKGRLDFNMPDAAVDKAVRLQVLYLLTQGDNLFPVQQLGRVEPDQG